jgi:hypothetical protein
MFPTHPFSLGNHFIFHHGNMGSRAPKGDKAQFEEQGSDLFKTSGLLHG